MDIAHVHLTPSHTLRLAAGVLLALVLLGASIAPAYGQDPPPPTARLNGMRQIYQTWNDCGPANLTMAMSYFGWAYGQEAASGWLKPNIEDKNVSPGQMAAFVNQQTDVPIRAIWRYGGTLDLLKRLMAAGFPVVAESGFDVEDKGWMGHYETLVAYDDNWQTIWIYDSYLGFGDGSGRTTTYADFDYWWRHFNRAFIVIFPLDREEELRGVLGAYVDPNWAAEQALSTARQEATANPADGWAWFNAGTSSAKLARYNDAAIYFDEAFRQGLPWRMLWYQFGPYEAYYNIGRYQDVLTLADNTTATTVYVEETNYWRGMAYAALGSPQDAVAQFNEALAFNPNFTDAQTAKAQVESGAFAAPAPPV
jgi:tetratricopeptide (TPR) repeat protein